MQGAAANPENEDQQQRLREAAEGLRVATNAAAQNAIKKKIVNRLEVGTRYCLIFSSLYFDKSLAETIRNAYFRRSSKCCKISSRVQGLKFTMVA